MTGDRIDLFLKESGSELERAEADGNVTVEAGERCTRPASTWSTRRPTTHTC